MTRADLHALWQQRVRAPIGLLRYRLVGPGRREQTRGFIVLGTLALGAVAVLALGALLLVGAGLWYWTQLPPLDKVLAYQPRQHLQVFTSDGVEIAQFGSERRLFIPITQMPKRLQQAVLAIEDTQFYEHGGISWKGLARAALANATGGTPQGASTITQQVARTFFLSTRRTPERKIKEALLALQIEHNLRKEQIFELYLNQIFLGQRAYGFGAAAQVYFGRPLTALSVAETAMLAGLPQNPIFANPFSSLERARKRQLLVLERMRSVGQIDDATHAQAVAEKLQLRNPGQGDINAQYVAEMARLAVFERFGEQSYTQGLRVTTSIRAADQQAAHAALRKGLLAVERRQPWRGPEDFEALPSASNERADVQAAAQALREYTDDDDLRVAIVTQANPREVQALLATGERVRLFGDGVRWALPALASNAGPDLALRRGSVIRVLRSDPSKTAARTTATTTAREPAPEWQITQWPEVEGAFVAVSPSTGRVRALVGGFDFSRSKFNHASAAWRQPGSSFKPFLYSAAFEHGVMPETVVDDLPLLNNDGSEPSWSPQNSDGRFAGPITVHEALVRSRNLVSVRLVQHMGTTQSRKWAARFGFDLNKMPADLTLALGTGSTTPLQMATAYAVLANGGHKVPAVLIERIVDATGKVIFEAPPPEALNEANRVIPARNAFLVGTLLNAVTRSGTAAAAQATLKRVDLYGKTGTTNDAVDAWFAGFQPGVVGVAWVGYDTPRSLGDKESGGGVALPIWIDSMAAMLKGVPVSPMQAPPGLVMGPTDRRYDNWSPETGVVRIGKPVVDAAEAASAAGTGGAVVAPVATEAAASSSTR